MSKGSGIYRNCYVTLRVFGKDLDFDRITKGLGIMPEHVHRKGERLTPTAKPFESDTWQMRATVAKDRELKEHVLWMQSTLSAKTTYLRRLAGKYSVDLYCSYHSNGGQGLVTVPPDVLSWCGKVGIPLTLSIALLE
jgi:hypothetical protein